MSYTQKTMYAYEIKRQKNKVYFSQKADTDEVPNMSPKNDVK